MIRVLVIDDERPDAVLLDLRMPGPDGPSVLADLLRRPDPCGHPGPPPGDDGTDEAARVRLLTGRERDVLRLLAEGLSNAGIGARMHLGTGTVKDHVSAILAKLRVTGRVQAAVLAQRAGLLGGPTRPRPPLSDGG